jgi:iron complex outermembrane receptor protein
LQIALQRGQQAPTNAVNFGESFGPLRSTQYEVGVKVQQSAWSATLAAFRTAVPSEFLAQPSAGEMLGRWVRNGERRYQGLELDGRVQPNKEWLLNASTAYLDARQTKAGDPMVVGKRVLGTTAFQASGFVQYAPAFLPGFRLFGGLRYAGKAYAQATNTFVFSPATVGDLGAGYVSAVDQGRLQLQVNIENATARGIGSQRNGHRVVYRRSAHVQHQCRLDSDRERELVRTARLPPSAAIGTWASRLASQSPPVRPTTCRR